MNIQHHENRLHANQIWYAEAVGGQEGADILLKFMELHALDTVAQAELLSRASMLVQKNNHQSLLLARKAALLNPQVPHAWLLVTHH